MNNIDEIYKMLNRENPVEIQQKGIELARSIKDISLLIMPPASPSVWEQCAYILAEKSNNDLQYYVDDLFEWIYDLNWPGAYIIFERLNSFPLYLLKEHIENKVITAVELPSAENSMSLYSLSQFLNNERLKTFLSEEVLNVLQKYYH